MGLSALRQPLPMVPLGQQPVIGAGAPPNRAITPQPVRKSSKHEIWVRILWWSFAIGLILIPVGFWLFHIAPKPSWEEVTEQTSGQFVACLVIGLGVLLVIVPIYHVFGLVFNYFFGDMIDTALKPVPTPAEIYVQLRQQLGREPTITEVQAIHSMLTSQRNEALVGTAILVGGTYEVWKHS